MPGSLKLAKVCQTFPVILTDEEVTAEKLNQLNKSYAEITTPCFLHVTLSKIPGANRGVFTKVNLPKGVVFGPYTVIALNFPLISNQVLI